VWDTCDPAPLLSGKYHQAGAILCRLLDKPDSQLHGPVPIQQDRRLLDDGDFLHGEYLYPL